MSQFVQRLSLFAVMLLMLVHFGVSAAIKPALWQVEHQNKVSYIFGSIHVGEANWYPLSPVIETAYQASNALVVELDMAQNIAQVQRAMMLAPDQTLEQQLSPATYLLLTEYLKQNNIPIQGVSALKPWAVTNTLAILPFLKLGLNPQYGIDEHFLTQAKRDQKPIVELETVEFQLQLLISLFDNEQVMLETLKAPVSEASALVESWKLGHLDRIKQLLNEQMEPQQYQLMLVTRNITWAKQLTQAFKVNRSLFVVVGAAHLVGADGLPALLQQQGLKVTRLQ